MCFNPRTHVGCDKRQDKAIKAQKVSIHAPTWGATPSLFGAEIAKSVSIHAPTWGATPELAKEVAPLLFQSTHPRGVRRWLAYPAKQELKFQSTHPRGVRHKQGRGCDIAHKSFNPRTHVGCDYSPVSPMNRPLLFQSTHPRGVRHSETQGVFGTIKFQSTHPRGVRQCDRQDFMRGVAVSIHAPTWGATPGCRTLSSTTKGFNPRTHVGCDEKIFIPR